MRKHIKGLFVHKIEQLGVERVIKISFAGADKTNKKFIFYVLENS